MYIFICEIFCKYIFVFKDFKSSFFKKTKTKQTTHFFFFILLDIMELYLIITKSQLTIKESQKDLMT